MTHNGQPGSKRRLRQQQTTPHKLLDVVLSPALPWPGRRWTLERSSLRDYQYRPTTPQISLAELYHENSKFYQQMLPELWAAAIDVDAFRDEYVRRRAQVGSRLRELPFELAPPHRTVLTKLAATLEARAFYAVDVRVVSERTVAVHEPVSDTLAVLKEYSAEEHVRLTRAVHLLSSEGAGHDEPAAPSGGSLIFILGAFARNEVLFGTRGYRHTMLEAGRVVQAAVQGAESCDVSARLCLAFADREVDTLMEADGVEQGTLAVIEMRKWGDRGREG
jgi:hypothetical protein